MRKQEDNVHPRMMATWKHSSLLLLSTLMLFQDSWTGECGNIKHWILNLVSVAAATREASRMHAAAARYLIVIL